jgi:hypothetical protein
MDHTLGQISETQIWPPTPSPHLPDLLRRVGPRVKAPVTVVQIKGGNCSASHGSRDAYCYLLLLGSQKAFDPDRWRVESSLFFSPTGLPTPLDRIYSGDTSHPGSGVPLRTYPHGLYVGQSSRTMLR